MDEDIKIVEQMIEEATAEALSYDTYCYEIKVEQVEAIKNILNFVDLTKDLETHIPKDIDILKSFNAGDEYTEKIKQAIENALDYIDRTEHTRKLACGFKKINDKKVQEKILDFFI